jgi:hypothetical protein
MLGCRVGLLLVIHFGVEGRVGSSLKYEPIQEPDPEKTWRGSQAPTLKSIMKHNDEPKTDEPVEDEEEEEEEEEGASDGEDEEEEEEAEEALECQGCDRPLLPADRLIHN